MKMERGNESHVLLLLDDVKPRRNFSVSRMIDALRTFDLDMASSAIHKYRSFASPTLQPSPDCAVRQVSFVDPLLLLFKRKAWECWQREINTTINRMGWGYQLTFASRCNASIGVVDTEVAVHANQPRLYSTTSALTQMRQWLDPPANLFYQGTREGSSNASSSTRGARCAAGAKKHEKTFGRQIFFHMTSWWTFDEDQVLLQAVQAEINANRRPSWKQIASKVSPVRTGQDCRCRYRRILNGQKRREMGRSGNKCQTCGQLRRGHSCPGRAPVLKPPLTDQSLEQFLESILHGAQKDEKNEAPLYRFEFPD